MHADTEQLRDRKGTDHTEYSALFSTLIFFCSQILTDKSSKCQCKTGDRGEISYGFSILQYNCV